MQEKPGSGAAADPTAVKFENGSGASVVLTKYKDHDAE